MTLELRIHQLTDFKTENTKSEFRLKVISEKMGEVTSGLLYAPDYRWNSDFRFMCSNEDKLTFELYQADGQFDRVLVSSTFTAQQLIKFSKLVPNEIKQYRLQLNTHQKSLIESRASSISQLIGKLCLSLLYDPFLLFKGQIYHNMDLSISDSHQKRTSQRQPIIFYKGKCPTTNMFSFLDQDSKNSKFKFIESIYQDDEV